MFKVFKKEIEIGGKKITLETGSRILFRSDISFEGDSLYISEIFEKFLFKFSQVSKIYFKILALQGWSRSTGPKE